MEGWRRMSRAPLPSGSEMWSKSQPLLDFIKWCLRNRPGTRGDDRILTYYVWRYYDRVDIHHGLTIEKIRLCTDEGTIRRRRQELQNDNPDLRPTQRVQHKREMRAEAVHAYYSNGTLADYAAMGAVA